MGVVSLNSGPKDVFAAMLCCVIPALNLQVSRSNSAISMHVPRPPNNDVAGSMYVEQHLQL